MLPSPTAGGTACAARDTGGKDELVSVRIVGSIEGRARLAVAAGFQLGAHPAVLPPSQRDLYGALAHRAFAGVLEQSARAGCQALVCGDGLFAQSSPSLEIVRAAMGPLRSARRAGMTVVATGAPPGPGTDGTDFLAEVGFVDAVLSAQASGPTVVSVANLQIGFVTAGSAANSDAADVTIDIVTADSERAEPAMPAGSADMVVDTRAPGAGSDGLDDVPSVATAWAGPSLERRAEPGFVILDIDPAAGVIPTFVPTEVLRPSLLEIDSPKSGGEVANLVARELGVASILDVELHGRISRAAWHNLNPPALIERAASTGTLLRLAIDHLTVEDGPNETSDSARSSFLVNARRTSERLMAAVSDDSEREMIAAARARVVEIARRREPTKAMS